MKILPWYYTDKKQPSRQVERERALADDAEAFGEDLKQTWRQHHEHRRRRLRPQATWRYAMWAVSRSFLVALSRPWVLWCDHRPPKKTPMCPDFIEPPARGE